MFTCADTDSVFSSLREDCVGFGVGASVGEGVEATRAVLLVVLPLPLPAVDG